MLLRQVFIVCIYSNLFRLIIHNYENNDNEFDNEFDNDKQEKGGFLPSDLSLKPALFLPSALQQATEKMKTLLTAKSVLHKLQIITSCFEMINHDVINTVYLMSGKL